ncbi:hypothetical protein MNBD_GAMMA01-864 [hydrothermal vent metagenome]|uniref:Uncharacterized protein n=1 Tax=hydrothermal vent metagenome TaxID=652676 RepID=A0A3B0VH15_9ZZZZ
MNSKISKFIILASFILMLLLAIFYKYKLVLSEERGKAIRILEKSIIYSRFAKSLSSYARIEDIVSFEEYLYCRVKFEYDTLIREDYQEFFDTEINNKDIQSWADGQFKFNLKLMSDYLQKNYIGQKCDFWGKEG